MKGLRAQMAGSIFLIKRADGMKLLDMHLHPILIMTNGTYEWALAVPRPSSLVNMTNWLFSMLSGWMKLV